ncbi:MULTISPECIES: hypothetical protein [Roseomonas]|nr:MULTISPECIES: hypothetical protein [Roseomonas]
MRHERDPACLIDRPGSALAVAQPVAQRGAMTQTDPGADAALPPMGSVLGVDVGFSPKRRSSAVCRLDWDPGAVTWDIRRFRAIPAEQEATIRGVAGKAGLQAAAFDGPLRAGLDVIGRYRAAERMLTRRLGARIGKPGQASAPVGQALNTAANDCVRIVLGGCSVEPARHAVCIHDRAVVEAFPGAFLGVMLEDPGEVAAVRSDRSDVFFRHLTANGTLETLLERLLPGRRLDLPLEGVTDHDDRAALVCALTALCVAAADFTAVGDADGWIILPPWRFVRPWAWSDLEANARDESPGCLYQGPDLQTRYDHSWSIA